MYVSHKVLKVSKHLDIKNVFLINLLHVLISVFPFLGVVVDFPPLFWFVYLFLFFFFLICLVSCLFVCFVCFYFCRVFSLFVCVCFDTFFSTHYNTCIVMATNAVKSYPTLNMNVIRINSLRSKQF
jgi:hypothetical protein